MRGMTSDALAAILSEAAYRTAAVKLEFDSAPVRLIGTPHNITLAGQEFLGVGQLGQLSVTEEAADLQAASMTIVLSGIPRDSIALAFAEPYQGRAATVWDVPMTSGFVPILDPIIIFRGRMDQMQVELGHRRCG